MLLVIDNYDSFTFNLVQAFGAIDPRVDIQVRRNDEISLQEIAAVRPRGIVVSPGPCTPREGGVSVDVMRQFGPDIPILGVCLGHQCMAYAFGGMVIRAQRLVHGKTSLIRHDGLGVYRGMSNPFQATRYHSLIVEQETLPKEFVVTATTDDEPREVMGIRHRSWPMEGVQFHPESFLTLEGKTLLANFLGMAYQSAHGSAQNPAGT